MKAFIDIGNTNIKYKYENNNEVYIKETTKENVKRVIKELEANGVTEVIYSSVVYDVKDALKSDKIILKNFREKIMKEKDSFLIDDIKELGTDLGAIFFAVRDVLKKKDAIVVSYGTAVTISVVKDGKFHGVNIIPGVGFIYNNFIKKIDRNVSLDFSPVKNIGIGKNNTSSLLHSSKVMVEMYVESEITRLKEEFKISEVIVDGVENRLVLDGLNFE